MGGNDPYEDGDVIGTTHIIVVKEIQDHLRPRTEQEVQGQEVRYIAKIMVKEVMDIPPMEITRINQTSQMAQRGQMYVAGGHVMLFPEKIGNDIHQDGYYSMPQPFRT